MKPNLLTFPHISSYPVLLLLGILAGWWIARRLARKKGIDPRHIDNITLLVPILGLAGARFFARLFYAKVGWWQALQIWKGDGLVFYGGFFACIAGIIAYALWKKLPLISLLDVLAPSSALGLAFGRIGCFMAGCCWGDFCVAPAKLTGLSPSRIEQVQTIPAMSSSGFIFAVQFPSKSDVYKTQAKWGLLNGDEPASLPVHPVQLYEATLALLLAGGLWLASHRAPPAGLISLGLLSGYATIRFITEFFRGDNLIGENGFTISQATSIYLAILSLAILFIQRVITARSALLHEKAPQRAPSAPAI